MFIEATDRHYYKNPQFHGEGVFFKVFDSVPTVCVRRDKEQNYKRVAINWLNSIGVRAKSEESRIDLQSFPPTWQGLHQTAMVEVKLLRPTAVPNVFEGCTLGITTDLEFIAWNIEVPLSVIYDLFKNGVSNPLLTKFYQRDDKKIRSAISRQIGKGFHKLPLEEARRQWGERILLKKKNIQP